MAQWSQQLQEMHDNQWLDTQTRLVIAIWTVYNSWSDRYITLNAIVEVAGDTTLEHSFTQFPNNING